MDPKGSSTLQRIDPRAGPPATELTLSCPICSNESISTESRLHEFDYGSGESLVALRVRVPVRRCGACAFEFMDEVAERLKHIAVCEHLGVLPPHEIRRIRKNHNMTRTTFCRVTGFGEASLNRWENGLSIQSQANDRYLRLLSLPENMSTLNNVLASRLSENRTFGAENNRFRIVEKTESIRRDQAAFQLRRAA